MVITQTRSISGIVLLLLSVFLSLNSFVVVAQHHELTR